MELSKNYNPASVEEKWYQHWLSKEYFNSKPDNRPPFTVVIPPPNVTGVLHMGHTLNETVQDILVRKARMSGFNACWVPGSDHASIATEAKVVQMLEKEKGIKKQDLSREEFLKYAFEWKEKYGGIIYNQIARLGCSVDWKRTTFTMDEHYHKAVLKVFADLYKKGLIYRGARMINWDPAAKTALSDEEVEYKDVTGKLYHIKYFVAGDNSGSHVVIATQRPETIMGDTGVCVNPSDERYISLRGKKLIVPLINREVPIVLDEYVDPAFGTGALKVTPAHDINDYNIGLKYNLEVIDTLNEDGTLSDAAQIYVGVDRFEARKKVVEELREKGFLIKEEEYQTRLGYSQRSGAVVEPRISTQWFLKMKDLAEPALKEVTEGRIKIHPGEKFLATYKYWLENVKDWCISRQLWWGQQIPAWYDENGNCYVGETEDDARKNAGIGPDIKLTQDEDVLDTWFSSWLWPIEVFKGITEPDNKELNYYYPTNVLVTGQDIIFFWVARMVMAGMEYKQEKPFHDVYFTGMVRDKQGRKMSKSLGNSPDLLELIDKYGADAVRFGIMISSPAGNDLLFDEASLEQGRNFNNKMWNALKLIKGWETRVADGNNDNNDSAQHFAITWFENRLKEEWIQIESLYSQFKLSEILKKLYSLIWDDFCSWYLEWVKPGMDQPVSAGVYKKTVELFEQLMQLLHPFMPFITEEIFHLLRDQEGDLCVRQYVSAGLPDPVTGERGELLKSAISAIRDAKTRNRIKPKENVKLIIQTNATEDYREIELLLAKQVFAESIAYNVAVPGTNTITITLEKDKIFIETEQQIDQTSQREELQKELEHLKGFLQSVNKKLENEKFLQNARPEVIALERKKKADAEEKISIIEETLKQ